MTEFAVGPRNAPKVGEKRHRTKVPARIMPAASRTSCRRCRNFVEKRLMPALTEDEKTPWQGGGQLAEHDLSPWVRYRFTFSG